MVAAADVEVHAEQDQWPKENRENGVGEFLETVEVAEVVVVSDHACRNKHADYQV